MVFVTELVAFFRMMGYVDPQYHTMKDGARLTKGSKVVDLRALERRFFAFDRSNFGIVHLRTDGKRLLVFTGSGDERKKEAYAYEMSRGKPKAVKVSQL